MKAIFMEENIQNKILEIFSQFLSEKNFVEEIFKNSVYAKIPSKAFVFLEGDKCENFALLLSGSIKVYKNSESGREITLYRISTGESCILTASCIISQTEFPAFAIVEEEAEAILIPSSCAKDWLNRYETWRNYIFSLVTKRFSSVLETIEEVAFKRVDSRIAEFLLKFSNPKIKITHQEIASELGTSREVVSRILKDFESENILELKRGIILLKKKDFLKKLCT